MTKHKYLNIVELTVQNISNCRFRTYQQAGRVGAGTAGRQSRPGQDGTSTQRFAHEITLIRALQGIEKNVLNERLSRRTNKRNPM